MCLAGPRTQNADQTATPYFLDTYVFFPRDTKRPTIDPFSQRQPHRTIACLQSRSNLILHSRVKPLQRADPLRKERGPVGRSMPVIIEVFRQLRSYGKT